MILRRLDWTGAQGTYTSAVSPCTERIARLDFAEAAKTEQATIGLELVAASFFFVRIAGVSYNFG
jgi:hypothetical protein